MNTHHKYAPLTPAVVLLSGGLDSSTLLAHARDSLAVDPMLALSVDYGQRHARELRSAEQIAKHYRTRHEVLDLTGWGKLLGGSALTDPTVDVPHGHYADDNMRSTVVPNRNATMLAAAAGVAAAIGARVVLTAVHAGDHAVYPDCRPEFIESMSQTAMLGTGGDVFVDAPFVHWTKTDIAEHAGRLSVPIDLTWSCYEGGEQHCGRCGTCVERREALHDAGVDDTTLYEVPLSESLSLLGEDR